MTTLNEVANELKKSKKKTQLIYAFNGTGKTRLSVEFKNLIEMKMIILIKRRSFTIMLLRRIYFTGIMI